MFQPGSLHLVAVSYTTGDIKDFLLTAKGKDKRNKKNVKFKFDAADPFTPWSSQRAGGEAKQSHLPQIWQ